MAVVCPARKPSLRPRLRQDAEGEGHRRPPDYCEDLNAIDKAEETLTSNQWEVWHRTAAKLFLSDEQPYHSRLSARQRAEVFLRTVGKWEEESLKEIEKLVLARVRTRMSAILLNTRLTPQFAPGVDSRPKADAINSRKREKMESARRLLSALDEMGY